MQLLQWCKERVTRWWCGTAAVAGARDGLVICGRVERAEVELWAGMVRVTLAEVPRGMLLGRAVRPVEVLHVAEVGSSRPGIWLDERETPAEIEWDRRPGGPVRWTIGARVENWLPGPGFRVGELVRVWVRWAS